MKRFHTLWIAALAVAAATTAIQAHHSFSMFDRTREQVLVGAVVRWAFNSPHSLIYIKDAKGTTWGFEGAAPASLIGRTPKIDGFTFKPGEQITLVYCPLTDGRSGGAIGLVVNAAGTWFNPADGGCRPTEADWKKWLPAGYTTKAQAQAAAPK